MTIECQPLHIRRIQITTDSPHRSMEGTVRCQKRREQTGARSKSDPHGVAVSFVDDTQLASWKENALNARVIKGRHCSKEIRKEAKVGRGNDVMGKGVR